jgi:hypothetical protein
MHASVSFLKSKYRLSTMRKLLRSNQLVVMRGADVERK